MEKPAAVCPVLEVLISLLSLPLPLTKPGPHAIGLFGTETAPAAAVGRKELVQANGATRREYVALRDG